MLIGHADANHGPTHPDRSASRCANGRPDGDANLDPHPDTAAHSDPCADPGTRAHGDSRAHLHTGADGHSRTYGDGDSGPHTCGVRRGPRNRRPHQLRLAT